MRSGQDELQRLQKQRRRHVFWTVSAAIALVVASKGFSNAHAQTPKVASNTQPIKVQKILASARTQAQVTRYYDPAYVQLTYPGGDVPAHKGVCSDVVIRALRNTGLDLQQALHQDMRKHFTAYPQRWGLKKPDPNIDHRRVPNLMTYLERTGRALPVTQQMPASAFKPGDIVAWDLGTGQSHIGIVSDEKVPLASDGRKLIFHNISAGVKHEDVLYTWKIIGHYRMT